MEIESSDAPIVTKKLRNKAKLVLYMVKKAIVKTKMQVDLYIKLKDGKLAWKAFTNLLHHHHHRHYAAFASRCASRNVDTLFISPQEHALRSNDTPVYGTNRVSERHSDDGDELKLVVIEVSNDSGTEQSPLPGLSMVSRELRVVDSPLPAEEESQVDKAAEEFIKKFYMQLKQQRITSLESPSPDHLWSQ